MADGKLVKMEKDYKSEVDAALKTAEPLLKVYPSLFGTAFILAS